MNQEPRKRGGQDDTQRREDETRAEDWADVGNLGVEAARKEDDAESHSADALRQRQTGEVDAQAVAAADHADTQEE